MESKNESESKINPEILVMLPEFGKQPPILEKNAFPKVSVVAPMRKASPLTTLSLPMVANPTPTPPNNPGQIQLARNRLTAALAPPKKAEVHRCPNCYGIVLNSQRSREEVITNLTRVKDLNVNGAKRPGDGRSGQEDAPNKTSKMGIGHGVGTDSKKNGPGPQ